MSTFPPKNATGGKTLSVVDAAPSPTSTGKGGIPASLKIKAAGTKDAPGVEKNVNLS